MKKTVAIFLTLVMCVGAVLPCFTLGTAAAGTSPSNVTGDVLYSQDFKTSTSDLTKFNSGKYADWKILSGTASTLKSEGGVLKVTAKNNLLLQVLGGTEMDKLAKNEDYTLSFDMKYTNSTAANYVGIRLDYADAKNFIEIAVRVRGNGYMTATAGGTVYSLEDDGVKANAAEVIAGTSSKGHILHSLCKTETAAAENTYTYVDQNGKVQKTYPTTLLTLLNRTDSSINATYSSTGTPLANKTLHYRIESIHGAGVIVSINGIVVTTTVKNVYYYDQLTAKSGTVALYIPSGMSAEIDNMKLVSGGAYTVSTNSLGIKVMSVNTLFSNKGNDFSMHWLVDENGKLRMEALLDVIALQDPDIIGVQERSYAKSNGTGYSENDIVEALIAMGYGVINNKTRNNSSNPNPNNTANPDGVPARYDAYNCQPIFYKTSKFIAMNNSSREDEYIKGGLAAADSLDEQISNGSELYTDMFYDIFPIHSLEVMYNVQLLIGDQAKNIDTTRYEAATVRYIGRITGYGNAQKTVTELHRKNADPTVIDPVIVSNTSGWLDVSKFTDAEIAKITYNSSTKKVVYNNKSYTGAYYRRGTTEPIAVLLTSNPVRDSNYITIAAAYNPDGTIYRTFNTETYGFTNLYFPTNYTEKAVTEIRVKGDATKHTDFLPVTLTHDQLISGKYLNATMLTQEQYDSIVFKKDGTTAATYNGVEYDGVYYVRNKSTATMGQSDSKGVTWGVLRMRENGQQILMMNTHAALIYGAADKRSDGVLTGNDAKQWRLGNAAQAKAVAEKVFAKFGEMPVIFTGDFNMGNSDPMYTSLAEIFDDSARLAPNTIYWEYSHHEPLYVIKDTGTTDKYGNKQVDYSDMSSQIYPKPGYPIDHIFVSPDDFTVTGYNVLNDTADELHMTDHCALMSELILKGVTTPGCSHDNGVYKTEQTVTLSATNRLDTIYYTTDGTDPMTSVTRRVYTGALKISGDVQLRARAYRDGVYSEMRVVNFAIFAELAITEIVCNSKDNAGGWDTLEGFEIVNVSGHSVDLADYIFWSINDTKSPDNLSDGTLNFTWDMPHMRVQEKGKYIMQPGEVFFVWLLMADAYKAKLNYNTTAGVAKSEYLVEYVTAEKLKDEETLKTWAALGYTGLDETAVGKVIYRKDYVSMGLQTLTGSIVDADHIVPLDNTTAVGIFPNGNSIGETRKDLATGQKTTSTLSSAFNFANSHYTRLFITYDTELTAENAFSSALLDNRHGAAGGFNTNADGSVKDGGVKEGSFTLMPSLDKKTGRITSVATAFNAWRPTGGMTLGKLTDAQKTEVSSYLITVTLYDTDKKTLIGKLVCEGGASVTLPGAAPTADGGVFCGWRNLNDSKILLGEGTEYTPTGNISLMPFYIHFNTVAGASVRTTPGSTGMRFTTTLNIKEYKQLNYFFTSAGTGSVTQGTFIVPQSYVQKAGGFDVSKFAKYLDIPARAWYGEDATDYTLAGSIANIYEKNYNLPFVGCGYLKIQYTDGTEGIVYATLPENGARTVTEVARAAYNDRSDTESEKYPYLTDEGDYSRYNEKQMEVILGFIRDPLYLTYNGTDFVATGAGTDTFTWEYHDNADTVTLTKSSGKWNVSALYLNGTKVDFKVDGNRLTFSYSFYTERY